MARPMYASVLPTIKCSDCGRELEISMMGDHICKATPGIISTASCHRSPTYRVLEPSNPQIHETNHDRIEPTPTFLAPKTFERPPSRSLKHAKPTGAPAPQQTPQHRTSDERPTNPIRSATDPVTSHTRSSLEHAGASKGSSHPSGSLKRKPAPPNLALRTMTSDADMGPVSPNINGGATVLKRMNTITSGPFAVRNKSLRNPATRPGSREKDSTLRMEMAQDTALPPPSRPRRPETDDSLLEKLQSASLEEVSRPTFLEQPNLTVSPPSSSADLVGVDQRPPDESESNSEKSGKELENEGEAATKEEDIKPLPDLTTLHSRPNRLPSHASVGSDSSLSSKSGFGSRTESSRSSHGSPFSMSSPSDFHHKKQTSVGQESMTSSRSRESIAQLKPNETDSKEAAFGEPSPLGLSTSPPSSAGLKAEHQPSPLQPLPLRPILSPAPNGTFDSSRPASRADGLKTPQTEQPSPVENQPAQNQRAASLRPTPRSKGDCKGCSKPIFGKSVKASDGRLTGRYHRDCNSLFLVPILIDLR